MNFVLEKQEKPDIEIRIVRDVLDRMSGGAHEYEYISTDEIVAKCSGLNECETRFFRRKIPIGSIPFVEKWLDTVHDVPQMHPIEIPKRLQKSRYLGRGYRFIDRSEIPETGMYFIKDVGKPKSFSFSGDISALKHYKKLSSGMYLLSDYVKLLSEYRVYVINSEIHSVAYYDGDPLIFPDINIIREIALDYMRNYDYESSFSFDVAITAKGNTILLEFHAFASIGLYHTVWGNELLSAYRDGFNYLSERNQPRLFL